jgi:hypothetical protein
MSEIGKPRIEEPSNSDWAEARRLATNLVASRLGGGGDAAVAGWQDVLEWVDGQTFDDMAMRFFWLAEALVRYAQAGINLSVDAESGEESLSQTEFLARALEQLDLLARFLDTFEVRGSGDSSATS